MADSARAACRRPLMLVGAAAAALIGPAPAFAQSDGAAAGATVGEVVVTSRRREESLQEVPVAVTAMSGAALEKRGFTNISQMEQVTPGLKFTPGGGGNSGSFNAYIRGVGDFMVQRTWSNAAAKAGHDPCVPAPATPYIAAEPMFTESVPFDGYTGTVQTKAMQLP